MHTMKLQVFKLNNSFHITKEHSNYYNKNGFIVFRNAFSKKEMRELDQSISSFSDKGWHNIMNPDRAEFLIGQSIEKISKIKNFNARINFIEKAINTASFYRSYLVSKRVKRILEKLIKKKFVGLMTQVIFKHANTKFAKLGWVPHQDNSYAKMKNHSYVTTNLFIHKATKKNGCLYLFPETHKKGLVNFKKYYSYHAKIGQKPGNRVDMMLTDKNKVDLEVQAGDYLIMNGNLVHGSYVNKSKKNSRHLLSFNYGVKGEYFFPGKTAKRKAINF